ncbi:glycosyltransferase family 9 protein [Pseudogulbenkiania sp. MAI-1]|uniref:glycosyltransferase family 9 protein n=1 Tax=Pseudogulbenkiania sp. MAI-1 TaxID=990370 RepID=UPI00045E6C5B|nr:glycosyltransferase family 9 protein [Pseudogulbenkiania sp. MAI-1]
MSASQFLRLLFVKIGAIGDLIMMLPTIRQARQDHPDAYITLIVGKGLLPLAELIPEIDELVPVDEQALYRGSVLKKLGAVLDTAVRLRWRRVDRVMIGHGDARYRVFARLVRAVRVDSWHTYGKRLLPVPGRLHANEYLRLYHGRDDDSIPSSLPYILEQRLALTPDIAERLPGQAWVALAPGGARNTVSDDRHRRWPVEHYVELAQRLLAASIPVVLTGGPQDEWVKPYFGTLPVLDLIAQTRLPQLVALYQRTALVVTHDSGPLHLAGLAGCRRIALFGATNPSEKVQTDLRTQVLWGGENLACRPCYDGHSYAKNCQNIRCLAELSVDLVMHAIQRYLPLSSPQS